MHRLAARWLAIEIKSRAGNAARAPRFGSAFSQSMEPRVREEVAPERELDAGPSSFTRAMLPKRDKLRGIVAVCARG